jgi:hypothetical protein
MKTLRAPVLVLVAALAGCQAEIMEPTSGTTGGTGAGGIGIDPGTGGGTGSTAPTCTGLCLGSTYLPRITAVEYANSLLDVFGVPFASDAIPDDGAVGAFLSNDSQGLEANGADLYEQGAEAYALSVVSQSDGGVATALADGGLTGSTIVRLLAPLGESCAQHNATCADAFVAKYVGQLYRRPLTTDEIADYHALYEWTVAAPGDAGFTSGISGTFVEGIQYTVEKALQSSGFLYRPEIGVPTTDPNVVQLTSHEMAARLASFLMRSVPDTELLAAADQDALQTPEQISAQVQRLMSGSNTGRMWQAFSDQWLSVSQLSSYSPDPTAFPDVAANWKGATPAELEADTTQTFLHLMQTDGTVHALLTSPGGVSQGDDLKWVAGISDAQGTWVTSVPNRQGMLTWPGMIIANGIGAGHDAFSHGHFRGLWIRRQLLCQTIAQGNQMLVQMALDQEINMPTAETDRARMQAVSEYQSGTTNQIQPCYSCHHMTNPIGYSLDSYDFFGRFRTSQTGVDGHTYPIDQTGLITDNGVPAMTTDIDGPITSGSDLIDRLADSKTVAQCMERQLARFALMREMASDDQPSLDAAFTTFDNNNRDLRTLAALLPTTDAFRYRRIPPVAATP